MGVESVTFKSVIQCLLVEANNSSANPEITQGKCPNLCTALDVLPFIGIQNKGACYCRSSQLRGG
jgi:hypothetical protein